MNNNQWVEIPEPPKYAARTCIQYASHERCQFMIWAISDNFVESDTDSNSAHIQNLQAVGNDDQLVQVQWELFDAYSSLPQCHKLLFGQFNILYSKGAIVKCEMYATRICLVIVCNAFRPTYKPLLMLFVLGKNSKTNLSQSLFNNLDYDQLLPIDKLEQGNMLWSRTINSDSIKKLYSEKLIVVQNDKTFDVLNARNGDLLHSIAHPFYKKFTYFLGSLCVILDGKKERSWVVDMKIGSIYNAPACLTRGRTEDGKNMPLTPSKAVSSSYSTANIMNYSTRYHVSSAVVCRIGVKVSGLYEAFML
ncbi:hypothetical protein BDF19DRAFT_413407 [Syncephalis fuscata]|nr:hypothetical protein BDF19DRAFT_413407 [Syncephalis fuscata]